MDSAAEALYAKVAGRVTREDLEARHAKAAAEFDGLLDDEAVALLVLDELGLNEGAYATLGDLAGRSEATVRVRVERIDPARSFAREGRDPGRVVNALVSDATGEARLVFWDKDVERAEELRTGLHLTVVHARVKSTSYGTELHVGPWSVLEIEGALDPARRKLLADVRDTNEPASGAQGSDARTPGAKSVQSRLPQEAPTAIAGALAWIGPTMPARGADGATVFTIEADVETPEGLLRVVARDAHVKTLRALPIGARIRLSPVAAKLKGATTEWHTQSATRIERLDS